VATHDPHLKEAAAALMRNDLPAADRRLRAHLDGYPTDVAALRMLAEVAGRLRQYGEARELLERCLELAPNFAAARQNYAGVLNREGKPESALPEAEWLLAQEPDNPAHLNLKAAILANMGDYVRSVELYSEVLRRYPSQPKVWMSMGHGLRTSRRQEESVAAYRRAIELEPTLGEAYWSLANLKTVRFSENERVSMQRVLEGDLADEDRIHLEFALGKALEDEGDYADSFAHYAKGNALNRLMHPYSADENTRFVSRCKQQYTTEFFAARQSAGAASAEPIFILGLPRAGSTLLDQILASHSLVQGTVELPDIPQIARELIGREDDARHGRFFESVAALSPPDLRALGERYLVSTRVHRKSDAPFFIDKMPNNFLYIGLIQLILPNAKIIDVRRHPLGCGFSVFKQHFARGQNFSYDLSDIGRYYADYVGLMAHIDRVMPGRIHRVFYESLVQNTEAEVRRVLEYCGLPFEESCLKFYKNERPVRTASSEQVRRPIFTEGMDHWRHYEPWLAPLKRPLGPLLADYPRVGDEPPKPGIIDQLHRRGQRETS
jgi:Tfp pilus assembly protein PilF